MTLARSTYNPNFPANWTPEMIDGALSTWSAQACDIRAQMQESIRLQKAREADAKALEEEKQAALAWCRDNGNPHRKANHD